MSWKNKEKYKTSSVPIKKLQKSIKMVTKVLSIYLTNKIY